ncbi:Tyrosine-protein phosphatase 1 [Spathaspora sp. JA1]|nr:Tyrosine-protein phosphatase 1 [Spathaspora sp. JA1]
MSQPLTTPLPSACLIPCIPSSTNRTVTFKHLPPSIYLQHCETLDLTNYQILFDIRCFKQYSKTRLKKAVNLCIPTTLLKRKSLNLIEILNNFINLPVNTKDLIVNKLKEQDSTAKIKVLIYDSHSKINEDISYSLYQTCVRFESLTDKFEVSVLNGGIESLLDHPEFLERNLTKINTNHHRLNGLILPSPIKNNNFNAIIKKDINNMSYNHRFNLAKLQTEDRYPNWLKFVTHQHTTTLLEHFLKLFTEIETWENTRLRRLITSQDNNLTGPLSPACCNSCRGLSPKISTGVEYNFKNRYNNIWPYEHSRVKLNNHSCDYFNGNYIDVNSIVRNDFTYIATQNTLASTVDDFWCMIFQENVEIIINLETGPVSYLSHPSITSCEIIENNSNYTIRKLNNKIFHLHYLNWPDHDIPNFSTLIELITLKNKLHSKYGLSNKVLVHCSAGCGRTGVFITLDSLIQGWINNKSQIMNEESDLIFRLIMHERRQRISMVQNLDQFIGCYQLFLYYLSQEDILS